MTPTTANLEALAEDWAATIDSGRLVRVEVWAKRFLAGDRPTVHMELLRAVAPGPGPRWVEAPAP